MTLCPLCKKELWPLSAAHESYYVNKHWIEPTPRGRQVTCPVANRNVLLDPQAVPTIGVE